MKNKIKCAMCNKEIEIKNSHNGKPAVNGRVCEECNEKVIDKRKLLVEDEYCKEQQKIWAASWKKFEELQKTLKPGENALQVFQKKYGLDETENLWAHAFNQNTKKNGVHSTIDIMGDLLKDVARKSKN